MTDLDAPQESVQASAWKPHDASDQTGRVLVGQIVVVSFSLQSRATQWSRLADELRTKLRGLE